MNPSLLGFFRGILAAVIVAVLTYAGDATHLGFLNPATASIVAALALALEHAIEGKTNKALFGAVTTRRS
jgi:hypothetical protein